jgi:hypothetical protein
MGLAPSVGRTHGGCVRGEQFTIGVLEDDRIVGLDGPSLAAALSAVMHPGADVAYLTAAEDVASGTVACAIALAEDAPLLLTERETLSAVAANELGRLGVRSVVIVGAHDQISAEVERQVAALGTPVDRITEDDERYTSVAARLDSGHLLGSDRFARSVALTLASFPPATLVFVTTPDLGLVLSSPDRIPVPAARAIESFSPAVVAVFDGES